jgi:DNA-binding MarR family transcriptional regulator
LEKRETDRKKLELPKAKRGEAMTNKDTLTFNGVEVTPRQIDYLHAIEEFWASNIYAPYIKEIAWTLGVIPGTAERMIKKLKAKGLVTSVKDKLRTLRTTRTNVYFTTESLKKTG